jgi:hypothetical protein
MALIGSYTNYLKESEFIEGLNLKGLWPTFNLMDVLGKTLKAMNNGDFV